ncbi:hypothetical protein AB7C87_06750 [Natrarchaeobius sp. A-rgal3]|uniref:hypothetical protein n=1 Tax=Natrarchaeobius versutus TaxID=1679078 RepID=UPI0035109482
MRQVSSSVKSNGGFSEVTVFDDSDNLHKRIEVFRASQPMDKFGVTAAGSTAKAVCGEDHLGPRSNQIYRNIYSEGQSENRLTALFEVVEELHPEGEPDGSWEVRARDVDVNSPAFGEVLRIRLSPHSEDSEKYDLTYELRDPDADSSLVLSPMDEPVTEQAPDLVDISSDVAQLGKLSDRIDENPVEFTVDNSTTGREIDESLSPLMELQTDPDYKVYMDNLESYMRFGDYGPKSTHPGTNLIGEDAEKIADYLVWREYRIDMLTRGRPFLPEMADATDPVEGPVAATDTDSKPGVYSLFVMANELDITLYELILDKVYSDYSGIPMKQAPGSRLETGDEPVVDAKRAIKTAGDVAEAFYLRSSEGGTDPAAPSEAARKPTESDD